MSAAEAVDLRHRRLAGAERRVFQPERSWPHLRTGAHAAREFAGQAFEREQHAVDRRIVAPLLDQGRQA